VDTIELDLLKLRAAPSRAGWSPGAGHERGLRSVVQETFGHGVSPPLGGRGAGRGPGVLARLPAARWSAGPARDPAGHLGRHLGLERAPSPGRGHLAVLPVPFLRAFFAPPDLATAHDPAERICWRSEQRSSNLLPQPPARSDRPPPWGGSTRRSHVGERWSAASPAGRPCSG
jgi:hypothetical protein